MSSPTAPARYKQIFFFAFFISAYRRRERELGLSAGVHPLRPFIVGRPRSRSTGGVVPEEVVEGYAKVHIHGHCVVVKPHVEILHAIRGRLIVLHRRLASHTGAGSGISGLVIVSFPHEILVRN